MAATTGVRNPELDPSFHGPVDDDPPAEGGNAAVSEALQEAEQRRIEQRARRMGWVPKDEFRGDPARWVTAEEFIEVGAGNNRILSERNEKLDRDLSAAVGQIAELQTRVAESGQVLKALNDRFVNADRAAYARARADLQREMREATSEADVEKYDAAKEQLDALDRAPPQAPAAPAAPAAPRPTVDAVTAQWVSENPWFKDDELSSASVIIHRRIMAENPGIDQREALDRVTDEIKTRYADRFENPRRRAAGSTRAPTGDRTNGSRARVGRTYNDLPDDAKKACDMFVRTMPARTDPETGKKVAYTRQDYLDSYEWDT